MSPAFPRLALCAAISLVLGGASLPTLAARTPADAEANPKMELQGAGLDQASCEAGRVKQQQGFVATLKDLGAPGSYLKSFDSLRNEQATSNVIIWMCTLAMKSQPDQNNAAACTTTFQNSIAKIVQSDGDTENACQAFAKASAIDCTGGGTECLLNEAKFFGAGKDSLEKAANDAQASAKFLSKYKFLAMAANIGYSQQLQDLARKIRVLQGQGVAITPQNPTLNAISEEYFKLPFATMLKKLGLENNPNPDEIEKKASSISLTSLDWGKRPVEEIAKMDRPQNRAESVDGNEFTAAYTASTIATYSGNAEKSYRSQMDRVDALIQNLNRSADNRGAVPDTQGPSPRQPAPSPKADPPPIQNNGSQLATTGSLGQSADLLGATGASRMFRYARSAAAGPTNTATGPDAPALADAPLLAATSNRAARASEEAAAFGSQSESLPEARAVALALSESPRADGSKNGMPAANGEVVQGPFAVRTAGRASKPNSAREKDRDSQIAERSPEANQEDAGRIPASLAERAKFDPSGTAVTSARAERLADAELATLEKSRPFSPSLRDLLRKRLAMNYELKLKNGSAAAAAAGGSAEAVLEAVRQARDEGIPTGASDSRIPFTLSGWETEAAVRRLTRDIQDENQSAEFGSVNVTLFRRVHDAHRRHFWGKT